MYVCNTNDHSVAKWRWSNQIFQFQIGIRGAETRTNETVYSKPKLKPGSDGDTPEV